jgi:hypothetical protein
MIRTSTTPLQSVTLLGSGLATSGKAKVLSWLALLVQMVQMVLMVLMVLLGLLVQTAKQILVHSY